MQMKFKFPSFSPLPTTMMLIQKPHDSRCHTDVSYKVPILMFSFDRMFNFEEDETDFILNNE